MSTKCLNKVVLTGFRLWLPQGDKLLKRSLLDSKSTWENTGSGTMFTSCSMSSTIAIILAFLIGILLYILKFKFALKIWIAKTHVKVFNHSLALCLFVSGTIISDRTSKSNLTPSSPIILHHYFQGLVLWFVSQFQYCFLKKREAMRKNLSKTSPINVLNRTSLKYDIIFTVYLDHDGM